MIILSRHNIIIYCYFPLNISTSLSLYPQLGQFSLPCEEGPSIVAYLLTLGSVLLVLASMPLSLMFVVKVVQVRLYKCTLLSFLRDLEICI